MQSSLERFFPSTKAPIRENGNLNNTINNLPVLKESISSETSDETQTETSDDGFLQTDTDDTRNGIFVDLEQENMKKRRSLMELLSGNQQNLKRQNTGFEDRGNTGTYTTAGSIDKVFVTLRYSRQKWLQLNQEPVHGGPIEILSDEEQEQEQEQEQEHEPRDVKHNNKIINISDFLKRPSMKTTKKKKPKHMKNRIVMVPESNFINSNTNSNTNTTTDEIEDVDTSSHDFFPLETRKFISKVNASSCLQNFKERQQDAELKKQLKENDLDNVEVPISLDDNQYQNSHPSFLEIFNKKSEISRLMKEKGINKTINPPILTSHDFHIYSTHNYNTPHRKLDLKLKEKNNNNENDYYVEIITNKESDSRLGPLLTQNIEMLDVSRHFLNYSYQFEPFSKDDIFGQILTKINSIKENSRLKRLVNLLDDETFANLKAENNLLFTDLFKPSSYKDLLIPSSKQKEIVMWFDNIFKKLNYTKKKPNRKHMLHAKLKNNEEDEADNSLNSFIVNDVDDYYYYSDNELPEADKELPLLIITGDSGIGKSAAITTIVEEMGYYIYNLDSSMIDKKNLKEIAIHQKFNSSNGEKQDSIILFDELPMLEQERDIFLGILKNLLLVTRKPVILLLKPTEYFELPDWLLSNQSYYKQIGFKKISRKVLLNYLSILGLIIGFNISDEILLNIIDNSNQNRNDLRKCINELQLLTEGIGNHNESEIIDDEEFGITYVNYIERSEKGKIRKGIENKENNSGNDYSYLLDLDKKYDRDYDYDFYLQLEESLYQGQMQGLTEEGSESYHLNELRKENSDLLVNKSMEYYISKHKQHKYSASRRYPRDTIFKSVADFLSNHNNIYYNLNFEKNKELVLLEFYYYILAISRRESIRLEYNEDLKFKANPKSLIIKGAACASNYKDENGRVVVMNSDNNWVEACFERLEKL
ncbi:hypothetical protein PACTADRAFT_49216 [Pachysolen tannophilus NRRL Y-2460]|uniref:ATPase AAA-type core domain-containing protein n=1 Tax=Pachysolen tannophilus NRRL Y-2460 TaxID=669874 RepID=A0A1E4TVF4_PACTA|nr:hypothetical protein PACTADRAFT_49216 [Pachysolen tannophilus NRRL Y-2460]